MRGAYLRGSYGPKLESFAVVPPAIPGGAAAAPAGYRKNYSATLGGDHLRLVYIFCQSPVGVFGFFDLKMTNTRAKESGSLNSGGDASLRSPIPLASRRPRDAVGELVAEEAPWL